MTKAFVRKCNNCNKPFLKEEGCNRMKCTCGNLQCYVCSSNVDNYSHFDRDNGSGKECPLYGDMEVLLKEQVAIAQERTVRELLQVGTGLKDDDIRVDKNLDARPALAIPSPTAPLTLEPCVQCGMPPVGNDSVGHICRPQVHICIECHRTFDSVNSLSQHRTMKHGNDDTRCVKCCKIFKSPDKLLQHQRDTNDSCTDINRKQKGSQTSHPPKKRRICL
jgi:hypothetical protein